MNLVEQNHKNLLNHEDCMTYLGDRNISLAATRHFKLGFETRKTNRLTDRILFPLINQYGDYLGFQGRALYDDVLPKYWHQPFDKSRFLYGLYENLPAIIEEGFTCLVEGNFDVLVLWQCGFPAVAPMGSAFTDGQALLLRRYTDTVVIIPDNDEAGRKTLKDKIELLKEYGFTVYVGHVLGSKDVADLYTKLGKPAIQEIVYGAEES